MQISSGGIGNGLYQEGKGCWRVYVFKENLVSRMRASLSTLNVKIPTRCVYMWWINMYSCWQSHSVLRSPVETPPLPPPVKDTVSERMVGTVILPGRPVFGEKKLAKGCDCDDGAAAEERGCSVLPECRILQKLHFAACQLRWQQPLSCPIAR